MTAQSRAAGKILVGLGANHPGPWGGPAATITRALREMTQAGIAVEAASGFYETAPIGYARQPAYINAAAVLDTNLSPDSLLRRLKEIERRAGRRGGRPWGPRTLDIDIIDYRGLVRRWHGQAPEFGGAGLRPLVLPHPRMHERPFVLRPLLDVAPDWRHPVFRRSARALWHEAARQGRGQVVKSL